MCQPDLTGYLILGMLEPEPFKRHVFTLSDVGHQFDSSLPVRTESFDYSDITVSWLQRSFFGQATSCLLSSRNTKHWMQLQQDKLLNLVSEELESAFRRFQMIGTQAIPLDITIQYICIRLAVSSAVLIDQEDLINLLSTQLAGALGVEVRRLPRRNESYIMRTSTDQFWRQQ